MSKIQKVLISDPIDKAVVKILNDANITVDERTGLKTDQLVEIIPQYDALIVRSGTQVVGKIIEASNLKIIGRAGVGVDNIDVEAATAKGIPVVNSPGGNTLAAAELTCGMMMALARHIAPSNSQMKNGTWDRKTWMGDELYGKTLAVVGLGRIGREVANRMRAFGMRTIGYDPFVNAQQAAEFNVEAFPLEQIWPQADYITLHVPLLPQTRDLLNKQTLAQCKRGVRIVNCARGGIFNEADMIEALNNGQVAGVGVDVYEQEPPTNWDLIKHPKVLSTPHLGASTKEAQVRVAVDVAEQFVAFVKGEALWGCVNPATLKK